MDEREIYQRGLDEYGESPMALHWTDYRSMAIRFKNLVRDVNIEERSVLDAGCGMGDILPYLYTRADIFNYLGVDVNPGFIGIAKKRYEGHNFEVADPFDGNYPRRFDVVLSSGVMNTNVPGWEKKRKLMIKNLFDLAGETLAFNMAGGTRPWRHNSLIAYADADEVLDYCQSLARRVKIRTDYLPQDFTILMFK
ncbi:MAG: methyltransferase family protein [Candidatus Saccharibacteria bacterium]|nr:methyltransferase family protein [Candidatus Saccharibacteria bacterium]